MEKFTLDLKRINRFVGRLFGINKSVSTTTKTDRFMSFNNLLTSKLAVIALSTTFLVFGKPETGLAKQYHITDTFCFNAEVITPKIAEESAIFYHANSTDFETNDENFEENSTFSSLPPQGVTLTLSTDCWGEETYWVLLDGSNNLVDNVTANTYGDETTYTINWTLDDDCYSFFIFDTYGDGVNGSQWGGCSTDGDFTITLDSDGTVLASLPAPNFGFSQQFTFCLPVVNGCTDSSACK